MAKASRNPMAAIQQMSQGNPQLQQVLQVVQQNGGDAKTAFYNMAKQKGVNPDDVLKQLQGML